MGLLPVYADRSTIASVRTGDDTDQRRFACAVAAKQRVDFSAPHPKIGFFRNSSQAEAFFDIQRFQDERLCEDVRNAPPTVLTAQ
jgi:hypothetical protein